MIEGLGPQVPPFRQGVVVEIETEHTHFYEISRKDLFFMGRKKVCPKSNCTQINLMNRIADLRDKLLLRQTSFSVPKQF